MKRILVLSASLAWASVAAANAAPASARAMTMSEGGSHATCSADTDVPEGAIYGCSETWFIRQTIRFVDTTCNTGSCGGRDSTWVEFEYSPGRKEASLLGVCGDPYRLYELGTCAC